jgi:VWFA-related protein
MCQKSNTVIYALLVGAPSSAYTTGPETLNELALKTGGHELRANSDDAAIDADVRAIESELRNQYRLVYNPASLQHDGSFHHIELYGPKRVETIQVREGYFAPRQ